MRILVLDDELRRHRWFDAHIGRHDSVWSAAQARAALQNNPRYDLVFLDHDLADGTVERDGITFVTWGEDGRTVARFIAAMAEDRRPGKVHIHSWNWGAAEEMERILRAAGVPVTRQPFPDGCHVELVSSSAA